MIYDSVMPVTCTRFFRRKSSVLLTALTSTSILLHNPAVSSASNSHTPHLRRTCVKERAADSSTLTTSVKVAVVALLLHRHEQDKQGKGGKKKCILTEQGRWVWLGRGKVGAGKWRQLDLNNNKYKNNF